MNITSLADLQALLDQGYRMTFYKEENDPNTPEPGPYRLMVFKWPRTRHRFWRNNGSARRGCRLCDGL